MTLFERSLGEHPERAKVRREKQWRWNELFTTLRKSDINEIDLTAEDKGKIEVEMKELEKQLRD